MKKTRGLYWVTSDLRLDDNPSLRQAASSVDELLIVFAPGQAWHQSAWQQTAASPARWRFLNQGLVCLNSQLADLGQKLLVSAESAESALGRCIELFKPVEVFASVQAGWYERQLWDALCSRYAGVRFTALHAHTLFEANALPFICSAAQLPRTFSAFRRVVEALPIAAPQPAPQQLPPPPGTNTLASAAPVSLSCAADLPVDTDDTFGFTGGELAARQHLDSYFLSSAPSRYKQVRNALDGWQNSTKLSPWLASGSLSVRRILSALRGYELRAGANESTYWIFFELLWREYFQWYAHAHGAALFAFSGIQNQRPVAGRDASRLSDWQNGRTDYPVVNACMNQLRRTGYLSNRGRQLVASCFVNELGMDWRLGAAWFEYHLLDYDVASNWGNWQYLAGVGADPRGKRRFDLQKQAAAYDPDGRFTAQWA